MTSTKQLSRQQFYFSFLASAAILLVSCLVYNSHLLDSVSLTLYDLNFRLKPGGYRSPTIVLVRMDSRSSKLLGRQNGNWSHGQMAKALDNLCQAGAEAIGLDLIYDQPGKDAAADQALARSINACNNVVLASTVSSSMGTRRTPLPIFQEAMIGDGFINFILDKDDVLRKLRFFNSVTLQDGSIELIPAFALELARVYLNIEYIPDFFSKENFRLGRPDSSNLVLPNPELLINYQGDYNIFDTLSYVDVVEGRFASEQVQDKLIIIGSSLDNEKDVFTTPITKNRRNQKQYEGKFGHIVQGTLGPKDHGVACHAHGVETILSGKFITPVTRNLQFFLIVCAGLVGLIFYLPRTTVFWESLLLFIGTGLLLSISLIIFKLKLTWFNATPLLLVFFLQFLAGIMLQKVFSRKHSEMVTAIFGKYVSGDVVNELVNGNLDLSLDGRRVELTILFTDLRNFTSISESLGAKETSRLLNNYFGEMIPHVFQYRGTLDKLIGDALMAFFGAPVTVQDHQEMAARTAIEMMESFHSIRKDIGLFDGRMLEMGIGLNSGEVTVGNLGSQGHVEYTVIGDAVNLASRVEGLTKVYGVGILLTEFTRNELGEEFFVRELDRVLVKGKKKPITIYELLGYREKMSLAQNEMVRIFQSGLKAYRERNWDKAEKLFLKVLEVAPDDRPAKIYIERVEGFRDVPEDADWCEVTVFNHK